MKIIRLTAENVKRLRAVEITPDGTLQVITGRNAQGKSSVLDAIWLALGGGTAARDTPRPVRDGEERASVTLDLGDLTVTRTWRGDKTTLTVKSADGATHASPQRMLDQLVGRLSFDPLAFTRMSPRDQVTALVDLVDLPVDLDKIAADRALLFDQRTELGRQSRSIGDVTVDKSLPEVEESAGEIIADIRAAQEHNHEYEQAVYGIEHAERSAESIEADIRDLEARIAERREALSVVTANRARMVATRNSLGGQKDTTSLEARLAAVEDTNATIRANNAARERAARRSVLDGQYTDLTDQIAALDRERADALAAADFPVPGLGFDDNGVTYQGVPLAQASSAEQIRVSLGMAMALNPGLRVIRIMDGSLLDAESLRLIADMAADADYQVWVERVEDTSESAVVIEDGAVAGDPR